MAVGAILVAVVLIAALVELVVGLLVWAVPVGAVVLAVWWVLRRDAPPPSA